MNDLNERVRLGQAIEMIDSLNVRIHGLERTERRLKKQLLEERERLKDSKVDAEGARNSLVLMEEKICEAEATIAALRQDVERFRGWWLNEYYSLKVLLTLVPQESKGDVRHIVHAAHARFATWSTSI